MVTLLTVEAVVILVLVGFIFFWTRYRTTSDGGGEASGFPEITKTSASKKKQEAAKPKKGYTTIALFGTDGRTAGEYEDANADAIMILSVNNDTGGVKLLSVYRDTAFSVDGEGTVRKANYAYSHGGIESTVEMLNRNLDLSITDYVAVDFSALADAIDALDGIDLPLTEEEANYTNSYMNETAKLTGGTATHVRAGTQHLTGTQAVAYCRIRYTKGGDMKRTERQREVLKAVAARVKQATSPELEKLLSDVFPKVKSSMSLDTILTLASTMKEAELEETAGFPFDYETGNFGRAGVLCVPCTLQSNVEELFSFFYEEEHVCSDTVREISATISDITGYDATDAKDEGDYGDE